MPEVNIKNLAEVLKNDNKVKLGGIDVDGQLRGKLMSKNKFLQVAEEGFGFCSVVFSWDMHDEFYFKELKISNSDNGWRDIMAVPDLSSFRRIPWEDNVPFFILDWIDPDTGGRLSACSRGLLKTQSEKLEQKKWRAMAGGEQWMRWARISCFERGMKLTYLS